MAKGGKTQQAQAQSQKKGGQQNLRQTKDKPSRGCCGCIFSLIRKLIFLTAISAFLYVATFTGYHYHVKQRAPTLDEFKQFSLETYHVASKQGREYYTLAEKRSKVYYATFEKDYLPTIQLYTKKYAKIIGEKAGDLKEYSVKYFSVVQNQAETYYRLALKKIQEYQSGKQAAPPTAAPTKRPETPTPKATEAPTTAKPTRAPTRAAPTTTPKPTQAPTTPPPTTQKPAAAKPVTTAKPAEAKKPTPSSKEKKEL